MKTLTPARVTLLMFAAVGLLVMAYIAKAVFAVDERPAPQTQTRNIPMAVGPLEPGTVITAEHIGTGPMPVSRIQGDMLLTNRVIVGRVVKEHIKPAEPIRASKLYAPGERPSLVVADGMRAISVSVPESVAIVDGLIKPNEFVDVHLTVTALQNDPRLRNGLSLTLFKGIRVVAINKNYQQGNVEVTGNTVTLELTAEQANILVLAREKGSITLSYNPEGKGTGVVDVENENRATLDEILGLQPLPEPEEPFTVEIFRRSGVESLQFQKGRRVDRGNSHSGESGVRIQTAPEASVGGRANLAPTRPSTRSSGDARHETAPAIGGPSAAATQQAGTTT